MTDFPDGIDIGPARGKWEKRALGIAGEARNWSSCLRDQVGACVMTADHDEFIPGFNDTPRGRANCGAGGCPRAHRDDVPSGAPQAADEWCCHAERNSLQRAGLRARGATLAVTRRPCPECARQAMMAGIVRIVL